MGLHTDWTAGLIGPGGCHQDKNYNPFSSVSSLMIWIKQMALTANLGESRENVRPEVKHQALEL